MGGRKAKSLHAFVEVKEPKDISEEDMRPARGRRRKTDTVNNSKEGLTVEAIDNENKKSRKSISLKVNSESSVQTLETLPEVDKVDTSVLKGRGKRRQVDMTPERSSDKKMTSSTGSGSSAGSVRSRAAHVDGSSSPSLRKVEALQKPKWSVMFTGDNEQSDLDVVRQLQGSVTESVQECTVLVTDKIRRTAKFLSMLAKGVPIVSPSWIADSKKYFRFLDPWDYILSDPPNEKKWSFKLADTLKKAKTAPLLEGLRIHVTKNVQPTPEMCQEIIQCGGGEFVKMTPSSSDPALVIVSCPEDRKSVSSLAKLGAPVMDKEWLLSGLLKYKLDKKLKL